MRDKKVLRSQQTSSLLANHIKDSYSTFVEFMTTSFESEERLGFGQDILQNLLDYRDFSTFEQKIVEFSTLSEYITFEVEDKLVLTDGEGFPEENGIILIDDEIILYRRREGNELHELQRGASGTKVLSDFKHDGEFLVSRPQNHNEGSEVKNLSTLFLVSMLKTIHKSFTPGIDSENVYEGVNRRILLQHIKEFFQSKGTKLGIETLFKILFGESDVDVEYPGDRMIKISTSTYAESLILRSIAVPMVFSDAEVYERIFKPNNLDGLMVEYKSFNDDNVYAKALVEVAYNYTQDSNEQYELVLNKKSVEGEFFTNPFTILTRDVQREGDNFNNLDITTITVQSTLGFPDSGFIFIDDEKIEYTYRTSNQFLGCTRGVIGGDDFHSKGARVYGPYYIRGTRTEGPLTFISDSWPVGLVESVEVVDGGLLHKKGDEVYINGPGDTDPRDALLSTFLENTDYELASQASVDIGFIGNRTHGVNGVYFDDNTTLVSSANLPQHSVGDFSDDGSVGPNLQPVSAIHAIPRNSIKEDNTTIKDKGFGTIGLFIDGVPAYSSTSQDLLIHGKIARFDVVNPGIGYKNPTVLLTPNDSTAEAVVDKGRIIDIKLTRTALYNVNPDVRITSGEDGEILITLDNYGRVTNAGILNPGRFYIDSPTIKLVDPTGKGKGAVITCVSDPVSGLLDSVKIENKGLDYDKSTYVLIEPIGEHATARATTQYWRFDKFYQVENDSNLHLDPGGGYLFDSTEGKDSAYGYMSFAEGLATRVGDEFRDNLGSRNYHSPLIGWAWDGNPIYGPYGFENRIDDSSGIARMRSIYTLHDDRVGAIPAGGEEEAYSPPDPALYPLGTFVEDYFEDSDKSVDVELNTELDETMYVEPDYFTPILATLGEDGFIDDLIQLDRNNGHICNTPEFPKDLYPDGVYCYFLTLGKFGQPIYPYIIGKTFNNRPMSQDINSVLVDQPVPFGANETVDNVYDDAKLDYDLYNFKRLRNTTLLDNNQDVELELGSISTGSIDSAYVEVTGPKSTKVGDTVYFNDENTSGSGAGGIVSHVEGEQVIAGYSNLISTRVISHRWNIDLTFTTNSYVFVDGSFIEFSGGARALVVSYNPETKQLVVNIISPTLIKGGDIFYDNRGVRINLPFNVSRLGDPQLPFDATAEVESSESGITDEDGNAIDIVAEVSLQRTQIVMDLVEPKDRPDGTPLLDGDLWWSIQNGRLYVYYDDTVTKQWVASQPLTSVPMNGSLDRSAFNTGFAIDNVLHEAVNNTITISDKAPDDRPDGTPNRMGDLWWSPHTGVLYIWYTDYLRYAIEYYNDNGELPDSLPGDLTVQWVIADPAGSVPQGDTALDISLPEQGALPFSGSVYQGTVTCIVSPTAPVTLDDGSIVPVGSLWWCNVNGKMFIKYDDGSTVQWVITNPHSSASGLAGSLDEIIIDGGGNNGGGGPGGGGILYPLDEPADKNVIWFEDLTHFYPEDLIEFQLGAPGAKDELAKIINLKIPHSAEVIRGYGGVAYELFNGTPTVNTERFLYTVETAEPHKLRKGEEVIISGSQYDKLNGSHILSEAGTVVPAEGYAIINALTFEVIDVIVTFPGVGYQNDFFITFTGGGGVGASAFAEVTPFVGGEGGGIHTVTMLEGGVSYQTAPTPIFAGGTPNTSFSFYTDEFYQLESGVTYTAGGDACRNNPAVIEIQYPGAGYTELPVIEGIVKKDIDKADVTIEMFGTSISNIKLNTGGFRYSNPKAVFKDLLGRGLGAEARVTVDDGKITKVTITNGGDGYLEPVVDFVEQDCKIVATTKDIGEIISVNVIDPGYNLFSDTTIKPEIKVTTRAVVSPLDTSVGSFDPGQHVYQGAGDRHTAIAIVDNYDDKRQILTLVKVEGEIILTERIYNDLGTIADVLNVGQADVIPVIDGTSKPKGDFLDSTSKLSDSYAVIQDSLYYQWFSYVIKSPLNPSEYETFVRDIIHPTGFAMFTEVTVSVEESISIPL